MALDYYVAQNRITTRTDDYMAVSVNRKSFSIDDVYDHMTRQGSTLTKAEALAAFEEVMQSMITIVQQGNSVVTPLVNILPCIKGNFKGEDDRFDPGRHEVRIRMNPGLRMQATAPNIETRKVAGRERQPGPLHFIDNESGNRDGEITAGGGARITGSLLKFDEADAGQGIFFVNEDDDTETRVDTTMLKNKPSELIFTNPGLAAGTYRLEVRSIIERTSDVRTGVLSKRLSVA